MPRCPIGFIIVTSFAGVAVWGCGNGNGGDPLISTGLRQAFGATISSAAYPGNATAERHAIQAASDLNCADFINCRWRNAAVGDKLDWSKTSGKPDINQWETGMGTRIVPLGDSAVLASTSRDFSDEGHLVSDPIGCMNSPIDLTVTAWRTAGRPTEQQRPVLRVCTRRVDNATLLDDNCQVITAENGLPVTVILYEPSGQGNVEIVIGAYNYIASPASAVFIRDLIVEGEVGDPGCFSIKVTTTTSLSSTITTKPVTTQALTTQSQTITKKLVTKPKLFAATTFCDRIPCSFENANPCSYMNARNSELNASRSFDLLSGKFRNPLTGIREPEKGRFYLAAYLYRHDRAVLEVDGFSLEGERVIRFKHYEATADIQLTTCCDFSPDGADCPFASSLDVDVADREWKQSSFLCPKNTNKIVFICENTGVHQGACGVDDIEVYLNDNTDPDKAITNACKPLSIPPK